MCDGDDDIMIANWNYDCGVIVIITIVAIIINFISCWEEGGVFTIPIISRCFNEIINGVAIINDETIMTN